ncbi:MAG: peptidoglycan binding domain-containing protein [Austwickia sp.]|nr:peptidoglycan binding domain-containing protein [Austwickia sp.]
MLMRTASPATAPDGGLRTTGWPVFVRLVLSTLVLALLYLALCWYAGRSIPPGTEVAGVSVGGLTQEQAAARVADQLTQVRRTPVRVSWPGGLKRVEPAVLGLSVDAPASVAGLAEFTLDPRRVWDRLTQATHRPGVVVLDTATADAVLAAWAREIDRAPVQAAIVFSGGTVQATAPQEGRTLDVPATREALVASWPGDGDVPAVLRVVAPAVPPVRYQEALDTVATPAVAGPLTVRSGGASAVLPPEVFAPALRMQTQGDTLVLQVDTAQFLAAARQVMPNVEAAPVDASVRIPAGQAPTPAVQPAVPGWRVQTAGVAEVVRVALVASERTALLPVSSLAPAVPTEQVAAWEIRERLAESPVPVDPVGLPDQVVVAPGQGYTWSAPAHESIEAVSSVATAAGLSVTRDLGADTVTITNPGARGVLLQVDRSVVPARFAVWGRAAAD